MERAARGNTARAIALAALFFGGLAGLGWVEGVFERLGPGIVTALAAFAAAFAVAAYLLDPEVRAFVDGARRRLRSAPAKSPGRKRAAT
jgi:hypothetical protein